MCNIICVENINTAILETWDEPHRSRFVHELFTIDRTQSFLSRTVNSDFDDIFPARQRIQSSHQNKQ